MAASSLLQRHDSSVSSQESAKDGGSVFGKFIGAISNNVRKWDVFGGGNGKQAELTNSRNQHVERAARYHSLAQTQAAQAHYRAAGANFGAQAHSIISHNDANQIVHVPDDDVLSVVSGLRGFVDPRLGNSTNAQSHAHLYRQQMQASRQAHTLHHRKNFLAPHQIQAAHTKQYSFAQGVRRGMSAEEVARFRTLHGNIGAASSTVFGHLNSGNGLHLQSKFGRGDAAGISAGAATKRSRPKADIKVEFADIDEILEQCSVAPPQQKKRKDSRGQISDQNENRMISDKLAHACSPSQEQKHSRFDDSCNVPKLQVTVMRSSIVSAAIKRLQTDNGAPGEKLD